MLFVQIDALLVDSAAKQDRKHEILPAHRLKT